jgi:hypothetical protein
MVNEMFLDRLTIIAAVSSVDGILSPCADRRWLLAVGCWLLAIGRWLAKQNVLKTPQCF